MHDGIICFLWLLLVDCCRKLLALALSDDLAAPFIAGLHALDWADESLDYLEGAGWEEDELSDQERSDSGEMQGWL